jgi:hypothetical protein
MIASVIALLVALAGSMTGQPAAPQSAAPLPPPSIVRAQILYTRILGTANCSSDPDAVCIDVLIEARLAILGQIAGPHVPPRPMVRYIYHIPAPRGATGWWLITRSNRPWPFRPAAPLLEADGTSRRELCVDRSELGRFGMVPAGGTERGDTLCYRR